MTETSSKVPLALYSTTSVHAQRHAAPRSDVSHPMSASGAAEADPYRPGNLTEVCLNGTGQLFTHSDQLSFDI